MDSEGGAYTGEGIPTANFVARGAAAIVDFVILLVLLVGLVVVLGTFGALIWLLIAFLGRVVMIGRLGQTPGKMLSRVKVVIENGEPPGLGRAALRETVGKMLSASPLGLGYLWSLFDELNQTWHDMLAGTYVVYTASYLASREGELAESTLVADQRAVARDTIEAHYQRAKMLMREEQYDEAREEVKQGRALAREEDRSEMVAHSRLIDGSIAAAVGDTERAEESLSMALTWSRSEQFHTLASAQVILAAADLKERLSDEDAGIALRHEAAQAFIKARDRRSAVDIFAGIGDQLAGAGDEPGARAVRNEGLRLAHSIYYRDGIGRLSAAVEGGDPPAPS